MKRLVFILGFVCGWAVVMVAQKIDSLTFEPEHTHLYLGIDQRLILPAGDSVVRCQGGRYYRVNQQTYQLIPLNDSLTLYIQGQGIERTIGYTVQSPPMPVITLAGLQTGNIAPATLKVQQGLTILLPEEVKGRCKIVGYTLYYVPKNQNPVELKGRGARFEGSIRQVINNTKFGDQYIFTDIKCFCRYNTMGRRINGISLQVR